MSSFLNRHIDSYEKKISIHQLHRMYREGRLVFPSVPSKTKMRMIESTSKTLETILMGIILPVVYVSERQDGSLLVLDASDRLLHLMKFLKGNILITELEFYPELNGCGLAELERKFPRIASFIYDYKINFQVIEYTTPKYMHMQVGSYIEKWDFVREQGIRYKLYGEELRNNLDFLERSMGRYGVFFSRWRLKRQYFILRILMYRFVFENNVQAGYTEDMGLQQLLDQTAGWFMRKDLMIIVNGFVDADQKLTKWMNKEYRTLLVQKGEEQRVRTLGYLYNIVWMCGGNEYKIGKGLESIFFDEQLREKIKKEKVTFANIRKHYKEIEKRLR